MQPRPSRVAPLRRDRKPGILLDKYFKIQVTISIFCLLPLTRRSPSVCVPSLVKLVSMQSQI